MSDSRFIRGTFILTAAAFISKFLGMVYIFPFYAMLDERGTALYTYAYVPYAILISVATMGVPLAVSKFVSKYNSLGDFHTGRKLYRSGMYVMGVTGFLAFLFLYSIAPYLSPIIIGQSEYGNTVDDVTYVTRMISFALLLVPMMSLTRGFFQGHQEMKPTAYSQVIEQIIRIAFLLGGSFFVIYVLEGEMKTAVGISTFAAFIGAIAGMLVLGLFWVKHKDNLNESLRTSKLNSQLSLGHIYKELFLYAGPFVFVGLAIPLYQLVDQFTFNRAMIRIGNQELAEVAYAALNFASNKLVMIPVSLATAFALTLIPAVTKSFTEGDFSTVHKQISQSLQIIMFLTLPAVIGLSILSYPAYATFFSVESAMEIGGLVLKWYAPVALFFALFTVTAAILQGINQQRYAVVSLAVGFFLKLILNVPLIEAFGTIGSILATAIGYGSSVLINLWVIKRYTSFSYAVFARRSLLITIFVSCMSVSVIAVEWILSFFITVESGRLASVVILLFSAIVGGSFYFWLGIRSNLMGIILGKRFNFFKKRKRAVRESE